MMGAEILFILLLPGVFLSAAFSFGLPLVVLAGIYLFFKLPREKKFKWLAIIVVFLVAFLGFAYYIGMTYC